MTRSQPAGDGAGATARAEACARCGRPLSPHVRANTIFCSPKCKTRATRKPGAGGWSDWTRRRRSIGLPAGVRETPCAGDLILRDGFACHVCGREIDPMVRWPAGGAMTLDHVIPVCDPASTHQLSNLKLAHMSCNVARGDGSAS